LVWSHQAGRAAPPPPIHSGSLGSESGEPTKSGEADAILKPSSKDNGASSAPALNTEPSTAAPSTTASTPANPSTASTPAGE
jgi:hypothetical protein